MSDKLTAKVAKEIANGRSDSLKRSRLDFALNAIKSAATAGRFQIILDTESIDSITKELEELGYRVDELGDPEKTKIRWG